MTAPWLWAAAARKLPAAAPGLPSLKRYRAVLSLLASSPYSFARIVFNSRAKALSAFQSPGASKEAAGASAIHKDPIGRMPDSLNIASKNKPQGGAPPGDAPISRERAEATPLVGLDSGPIANSFACERDLIAALATPSGPGAVGVVRLSGEGAADCLSKIFSSWRALVRKPRTMVLGRLVDPAEGAPPAEGAALDQALAVFFPAPGSFTGEDCAEIHCHGGSTAPRLALEAVLSAGARLARPGEFTQRAFLNGRLSLDQAEAVAELVAAQSQAEAALAARHLEGALSRKINPLFESLRAIAADLAAALDFLDEEWTEADRDSLLSRLSELAGGLASVIALGREGRIYRDGLRVVLAGPPNAGKSSLFNALLGRDRALVSPRPGTTRDYLEASVSWSGLRAELVDTAGLRSDGADELESQGQLLSMRELERADVVLWLRDLADPEAEGPPALEGAKILSIGSKADLAEAAASETTSRKTASGEPPLVVSAVTGSGLERLKEAVLALAGAQEGPGPEVVPNLRQRRALEDCLERVKTAQEALEGQMPPDIAAIELKDALTALGAVTGATFTDDLLEEVFSRFCLGK